LSTITDPYTWPTQHGSPQIVITKLGTHEYRIVASCNSCQQSISGPTTDSLHSVIRALSECCSFLHSLPCDEVPF
jgi:hypothetical protein